MEICILTFTMDRQKDRHDQWLNPSAHACGVIMLLTESGYKQVLCMHLIYLWLVNFEGLNFCGLESQNHFVGLYFHGIKLYTLII